MSTNITNIETAIDATASTTPAATAETYVTVKLHKPLTYEGKTYDKLRFDFDALTGNDHLAISQELRAENKTALAPAFSSDYLSKMAIRASKDGLGVDALLYLSLKDAVAVEGAARNFLIK